MPGLTPIATLSHTRARSNMPPKYLATLPKLWQLQPSHPVERSLETSRDAAVGRRPSTKPHIHLRLRNARDTRREESEADLGVL